MAETMVINSCKNTNALCIIYMVKRMPIRDSNGVIPWRWYVNFIVQISGYGERDTFVFSLYNFIETLYELMRKIILFLSNCNFDS